MLKLVAALLLLLGLGASAAELGWVPARTSVFIVGILEWKDGAMTPFPKKGRRDTELAEFFKQQGVPEKRVFLIQDKDATTAATHAAFDTFLQHSQKDETLFVYYCGHGYGSDEGDVCFATFDASGTKNHGGWAVPAIFDSIEKHFTGTRVISLADCCQSGGLADMAKTRKSSIQYAALASVISTESSTGCWTFSDSLLDALRGAPQVDLDGDGFVSFAEASRYSHAEMDFFDSQTASSATANGFDPNFRLALTSGKKAHERVGEYVELKRNSERARIDDYKNGKFAVRFASPAQRRTQWLSAAQFQKPTPAPAPPSTLAVGASVKVEWKKRWWPARILKIEPMDTSYYITYEGYGDEWNEWVPPQRIRSRR